jgi:hypothetical protein
MIAMVPTSSKRSLTTSWEAQIICKKAALATQDVHFQPAQSIEIMGSLG